MAVISNRRSDEIILEEDPLEPSGFKARPSFVDEQEWKLHEHVEVNKRLTMPQFDNDKFKHAVLSVSSKAMRRPGFFLYNILLVMVLTYYFIGICSQLLLEFLNRITLAQYNMVNMSKYIFLKDIYLDMPPP